MIYKFALSVNVGFELIDYVLFSLAILIDLVRQESVVTGFGVVHPSSLSPESFI
jgi:hypothetical protein